MVAGSTISLFIVLWRFEGRDVLQQQISRGKGVLPGMQGRYFIPLSLPALLLVSNRRFRFDRRISVALIAGAVVLSNVTGLIDSSHLLRALFH